MNGKPEDFIVQAWKRQLDSGLRAVETIVDGGVKLSEAHLKAAASVHAEAEATRKAIAAATDPAQMLGLQVQWARAGLEGSAAYWRSLQDVVAQTSGGLVSCLCSPPPVLAPDDASKAALVAMIDGAYRQWLDSARQFYSFPMTPAETKARAAA